MTQEPDERYDNLASSYISKHNQMENEKQNEAIQAMNQIQNALASLSINSVMHKVFVHESDYKILKHL